MPYEIVGGELREGCFESADGLFPESCSHQTSKDVRIRGAVVRDGMEDVAGEVRESELLLYDICWVLEKQGRK